jgi:D-arginine dehydrogenase
MAGDRTRQRVVVVGGGIAGVATAHRLAATHEVVLLEAEGALGTHATGRSAATLSETSGTRVMCALARASRPFLESPPDGFADAPLTGPRGLLWIGRDGHGPEDALGASEGTADGEALDALAAVAASGVAPTARRVDTAGALEVLPTLRPEAVSAGGLYEPDARSVDVALLLQSYARGARAAGAEFDLDDAFTSATQAADGTWSIVTRQGRTLTADLIVDAAGAWGDDVAERAGVAPLGLRPLRRTACLVPVPEEVDGRRVADWPLVMDIANRCYFEPETGGLLISPADEHPSDPVDARPEEEDVAWAIEMVNATLGLGIRSVRNAWAGLRTFTPDRSPAAGPDPEVPGFVWLVGQGGAGIKTAPALAEVVAATIGAGPWPAALSDLGVGPADLSPARFRH